jgi:hypothetical protein
MSLINLDKNLKFGMFWDDNLNFWNYLDTLHHARYNVVNVLFKNFIHRLEVYRDKLKPEIIIEYSDCIKYRIKAVGSHVESTLSDFNTTCDDIIHGKLVVTKRSSHLLEFIDAINILFGVRRISLIDVATPRKYMNIYIEKNNNTEQIMQDIDLSIYMVMKYNQTFYERYNYQFCNSELDYAAHKNLLRNFDFKTFYRLLSYDHRKIVDKRLKYLDNKDFKYLGDFYVNAYDQLDAQMSKRRLLQLQSLLFNPNYPWFSMVNVLTSKKRCMEKIYS